MTDPPGSKILKGAAEEAPSETGKEVVAMADRTLERQNRHTRPLGRLWRF